ncbi:hypothetical protein [Rhodohalobacter sp. 8-1]|uniref:hypothetical protein n=1 Tax=Rhodohalobacter sp. 8-1 TaxID=3131972 RepID=UPI0030EE18BF
MPSRQPGEGVSNTPSNEKRKQKTNNPPSKPRQFYERRSFFLKINSIKIMISFFNKGIQNKFPERDITLKEVHNYIISDAAKEATERLESEIITQMGRG